MTCLNPLRLWFGFRDLKWRAIKSCTDLRSEASMSSWRVVGTKADPKGQQIVIVMDESSWKVLHDTYHGRLHLQFSSVSFRLLGRKTKEQAEAQEQMDTIVAGQSNLSTPAPGGGDGNGSA
ncbi:hypothetical protein Trydic_g14089 [Trypoxylus dichotomus]